MARFEEAENRIFKLRFALNVTLETHQALKCAESVVTKV